MNFSTLLQSTVFASLLAGSLNAQVTVKLEPTQEGKVAVTLTNTSDSPVSILHYTTPLYGMEANLFRVSCDGREVPYIGKMALRLAPQEQDWVTLDANESVSAEMDMSEHYALDRAGNYSIQFSYPISVRSNTRGITAVEAEEVESNIADLSVDEARSFVPEETRATRGFSGCTTTQKNSISSAFTSYKNLAAKAQSSIGNNTTYRTWWGTYSSSNATKLRNNYTKVYNANNNGNWNVTCTTCESGVIAYVYKNRPSNVWICNFFHQFSSTEKGSFLLHEVTHWNTAIGTNDYGYGESFCKNLASQGNASRTLLNADNYRYYAMYARSY